MAEDLGSELASSLSVTEEQLATAQKMQSETGGDLLRILVKLGFMKEEQLLEQVAKREGMDVVKPEDLKPDEEIIARLPRDLLEKHGFLPISHTVSHLKLALSDPGDLPALEDVRFRTGLEVDIVLASSKDVQRLLAAHFNKSPGDDARGGTRRSRPMKDAREMAKQVGMLPAAADAARAVGELEASPAKLMRAIAALLIEKQVVSANELKDWVHRLE
jgi:type IV pilus assembly protein PilB